MGRNLLSIFEGILPPKHHLPPKQHLISNNKDLPATFHHNHLETEARSPCRPAPHRGHSQKEKKGHLCSRANILFFSCIGIGEVYKAYQMNDNFNWSDSFNQAANARERKRMDGVNAAFLRQNKFYSSFFASTLVLFPVSDTDINTNPHSGYVLMFIGLFFLCVYIK